MKRLPTAATAKRAALALLFCCPLVNAQADGDKQRGAFLFDTCSGCHAVAGYANAYPSYHVPRLAGQYPEYIQAALQAYKSGLRSHPTMQANAANLSDQDMADIAAFLASAEVDGASGPLKGNPVAGKEKAAGCASCHGANGAETTAPTFPKLAGQYESYLARALYDYRSKARDNAVMYPQAAALSDQDIADLAAYYASQEPALGVVDHALAD